MRKLEMAAHALERSRIGAIARRLPLWQGVLVLNYHRIGSPSKTPLDRGVFSATPEQLDAHLTLLTRSFEVIAPDDLLERPSASGRRVLLTLDDGYRDSYEMALPILQRHGLRATFFVVPGFIDRPQVSWWDAISWMLNNTTAATLSLPEFGLPPLSLDDHLRDHTAMALTDLFKSLSATRTSDFLRLLAHRLATGPCPPEVGRDLWMTWDHVRELADAGMVIGGHSLTHPVLSSLSRRGQAEQIDGCAERLRDEVSTEMQCFSYPVGTWGTYDATTQELLARAGVRLAFSFEGGYSTGAVKNVFEIPRAAVSHDMSAALFNAVLTSPALFARW